jgi:hypothetical protein
MYKIVLQKKEEGDGYPERLFYLEFFQMRGK